MIIRSVFANPGKYVKRWSFVHRRKTYTSSGGPSNKGKGAQKIALYGGIGAAGIYSIYTYVYSGAFSNDKKKKRLVVLGSGWAAVSLLKHLDPNLYDVSLVSPTNYFLFTPFLPSVTVGTVEPRSIVEPVRRIIGKRHANRIKFFEAECYGVDDKNGKIMCKDISDIVAEKSDFELPYDCLVIAVGSETQTYNIKGVKEHSHFLKDIKDVQKIRNNIMDCLESAGYPGQSEDAVKRLLHFVVVGGGPTGVEFAAELNDFLRKELHKHYPHIAEKMSITLIGGHNKLLCAFDEEISRYVEEKFSTNEINLVRSRVVSVEEDSIQVKEKGSNEIESIPFGMCVWAAGVSPRKLTKTLIQQIPGQKNRNALVTDAFLQVKNSPGIFAIGDCGTVEVHNMQKDVDELFRKADVNNDGVLSVEEFGAIMKEAMIKYPHLSLHLKKAYKKSIKGAFDAIDVNKDNKLSIDEFRAFLRKVDSELKSLPATAQVAAQQGKYLGKLLSQYHNVIQREEIDFFKEGASPFEYRHLGSFAYVGDDRAVLTLPIIGSFKGLGTMWLWRATYTSECVGWRMKMMILFDWVKTGLFGRDTSRI